MGEWQTSIKIVIVANSTPNAQQQPGVSAVPPRKKQPAAKKTPAARSRKKAAPAEKAPPPAARKRTSRRTAPAVGNGARSGDLVIVESPAKAKTINKYLGSSYRVLASYGHVRDLPRRRRKGEAVAGVDIDAGWVPTYVVEDRDEGAEGRSRRRSPKDILAELKREAARAERILLATDPDREGEAIAWHLEDELGLDEERTFRITFNEITKSAVQHALAEPGKIDMHRVRAQEARRILDRVVGYPLSNLVSRKVARALSAGRVQSVALRLVVDREREIRAFKEEEYWKVTALLAPTGTVPFQFAPFRLVEARARKAEAGEEQQEQPALPEPPPGAFRAELAEWAGQKFEAGNRDAVAAICGPLDTAAYAITRIEQKDRQEKAPPPFTTSTLQQQASIRLRFRAEHTMRVAQRLYEGVDLGSEGSVGLITYMRTDSTRVASEALGAVRTLIGEKYGPTYLPEKPNFFSSGKSAQEAHEAIRPTDLSYTPERVERLLPSSNDRREDHLRHDLVRLYTLIYNRFVASQMTPAIFAVTNVEVTATTGPTDAPAAEGAATAQLAPPQKGLFKAQGKILKFDGFRRVLAPGGKQEDATLPALAEGQALDRLDLVGTQHFTQPPPRYNEASLVKALEKEGIGRPSTYASIIGKITSEKRSYIEVKDRRFYATEIGEAVTDLLVEHFPKVMDLKFTSHMEEELDEIETGKMEYRQVLDEFWGPFSEALRIAEEKMPAQRGVETGEKCPECSKPLVIRYSKKTKRKFIGCSGWPECPYIKPGEGEEARPAPVLTEHLCPTCGKPMVQRMSRRGPFLGCSGYPECTMTMNLDAEGKPVPTARPTEHSCEKCGKPMVLREGRRGPFLACSGYPQCKNAKDVDAEGNPVQPIDTGIECEKCGAPMAVRRGPRGPFLGCSRFPKCRSTKQMPAELKEKVQAQMPARKALPRVEVSETCPECGAAMTLRQGRKGYFLGCTNYSKTKCKGAREVTPEVMEQLQATTAT
jgi:DNA topoisomerase-1